MNTRSDFTGDDKASTTWHTLRNWLSALDEGMNYDPHEYANSMVRLLVKKVERLETRVSELESQATPNGGQ